MKCNKCGEINQDEAKFCASCGAKLEAKKIFCTECGNELDGKAKFCSKCGTKRENAKVTVKNNDKTPWNFDSKIVTVTFLICSVIATYLFASPRFISGMELSFLENNILMGTIAIIIGSILIFLSLKKEKINKDNELKRIKELKITRFQVGLVFAIAGLVILMFQFKGFHSGDDYLILCLILFCSFLIMVSLIVALNGSKLKLLGEFITLGISIILFIITGLLYTKGNSLNHDGMSRVESFFETGNANPGTDYINASIFTLIGAIIFLIIFFLIKRYKGKEK